MRLVALLTGSYGERFSPLITYLHANLCLIKFGTRVASIASCRSCQVREQNSASSSIIAASSRSTINR